MTVLDTAGTIARQPIALRRVPRFAFSPFFWARSTVAAHAVQHARVGYPRDEHCRDVDTPLGDVDEAIRAIREVTPAGPSPARRDDAANAGPLPSHPSTPADDLERALRELDPVLLAYGATGQVDRATNVAFVRVLADVVRRRGIAPGVPGGPQLSLYEAAMINIDEWRITGVCEQWQRARTGLEARIHQTQHHFEKRLEEYVALVTCHRAKGFAEPNRMLPWRVYLPLMALLGVLEYPLNAAAFNVMRDQRWLMYLLACLPSIAIPALAHALGARLRHRSQDRAILLMAMILTSALLGIGGVVVLRWAWFEARGVALDLLLVAGLTAMNLLAFGVGSVFAYFAHDPDAELEHLHSAKKRLWRRLLRPWRRWTRLASAFDKARASAIERTHRIRDDARARLDEYRLFNTLYRADDATPRSFRAPISDRLFRPRDFGAELDHVPRSLEDVIRIVESRIAAGR